MEQIVLFLDINLLCPVDAAFYGDVAIMKNAREFLSYISAVVPAYSFYCVYHEYGTSAAKRLDWCEAVQAPPPALLEAPDICELGGESGFVILDGSPTRLRDCCVLLTLSGCSNPASCWRCAGGTVAELGSSYGGSDCGSIGSSRSVNYSRLVAAAALLSQVLVDDGMRRLPPPVLQACTNDAHGIAGDVEAESGVASVWLPPSDGDSTPLSQSHLQPMSAPVPQPQPQPQPQSQPQLQPQPQPRSDARSGEQVMGPLVATAFAVLQLMWRCHGDLRTHGSSQAPVSGGADVETEMPLLWRYVLTEYCAGSLGVATDGGEATGIQVYREELRQSLVDLSLQHSELCQGVDGADEVKGHAVQWVPTQTEIAAAARAETTRQLSALSAGRDIDCVTAGESGEDGLPRSKRRRVTPQDGGSDRLAASFYRADDTAPYEYSFVHRFLRDPATGSELTENGWACWRAGEAQPPTSLLEFRSLAKTVAHCRAEVDVCMCHYFATNDGWRLRRHLRQLSSCAGSDPVAWLRNAPYTPQFVSNYHRFCWFLARRWLTEVKTVLGAAQSEGREVPGRRGFTRDRGRAKTSDSTNGLGFGVRLTACERAEYLLCQVVSAHTDGGPRMACARCGSQNVFSLSGGCSDCGHPVRRPQRACRKVQGTDRSGTNCEEHESDGDCDGDGDGDMGLLERFAEGRAPFRYKYPGPVIYWLHDAGGGEGFAAALHPHWAVAKGLAALASFFLGQGSGALYVAERTRALRIGSRILDLLGADNHMLKRDYSRDRIPPKSRYTLPTGASMGVGVETSASGGAGAVLPIQFYPPALQFVADLFRPSLIGFVWEARLRLLKRYFQCHCQGTPSRQRQGDGQGVRAALRACRLLLLGWGVSCSHISEGETAVTTGTNSVNGTAVRWRRKLRLLLLAAAMEHAAAECDICSESRRAIEEEHQVLCASQDALLEYDSGDDEEEGGQGKQGSWGSGGSGPCTESIGGRGCYPVRVIPARQVWYTAARLPADPGCDNGDDIGPGGGGNRYRRCCYHTPPLPVSEAAVTVTLKYTDVAGVALPGQRHFLCAIRGARCVLTPVRVEGGNAGDSEELAATQTEEDEDEEEELTVSSFVPVEICTLRHYLHRIASSDGAGGAVSYLCHPTLARFHRVATAEGAALDEFKSEVLSCYRPGAAAAGLAQTAAGTQWRVAWSEGVLWRCLWTTLLQESVFDRTVPHAYSHAALVTGAGGVESARRQFKSNRHQYQYPADLLPERYSAYGVPPLRTGFFKARCVGIKRRLQELRSMSPRSLMVETSREFRRRYCCGCGQCAAERQKETYCSMEMKDAQGGSKGHGADTDIETEVEVDFLLDDGFGDVTCETLGSFACALGPAAVGLILEEMARTPDSLFRGAPDLVFWRSPSPRGMGMGIDMETGMQEGAAAAAAEDCFPETRGGGDRRRDPAPWVHTAAAKGDAILSSDPNPDVFLVEVKSFNDVISKFQLCWFELLRNCNITVEVAKVVTEDY